MSPATTTSAPPPPDDLADLILQLRELRQRVSAIEARLGAELFAGPVIGPVGAPAPIRQAPAPAVPALDLPPNALTSVGRMLLAIAGAYVLRSLTDWGVLPPAAGVAIGLIYALLWLWLAALVPAGATFAAALSASTSMLIMGPLLWEASQRIKVLSSASSAAVLVVFALTALALGFKEGRRIVATIAGLSCILIAAILLIARDDILPFTAALLIIGAAMELAAYFGPPPGARLLAALASAGAVLLFSYLISGPQGMPEAWVSVSRSSALATQIALAIIYGASAVMQAIVRRKTLAFAEIAQTGLAIVIGIGGALHVFERDRSVMLALGVGSLAAGLALYAVSFFQFERHGKRNFRALSAFGLALVLAGIFLPLPRLEFWILSCFCGVICYWAARSYALPTLGLHGAFYLLLSSAVSGATGQPFSALFAAAPSRLDWPASLTMLAASIACWAAVTGASANALSQSAPGYRRNQISSLVAAAHGVWIVAGLTIAAASRNASIPTDTLGTAVLTALSLALAWAAARWRKPELLWIVYGLMALGGYKLATRDFVDEHNLAMVVSLLCYGGALILLPRLRRAEGRTE